LEKRLPGDSKLGRNDQKFGRIAKNPIEIRKNETGHQKTRKEAEKL